MGNPKVKLTKFFRPPNENERKLNNNDKVQFCRFCGWKTVYHATRMVKHIQGCFKTPAGLKETEAVCTKAKPDGQGSSSLEVVSFLSEATTSSGSSFCPGGDSTQGTHTFSQEGIPARATSTPSTPKQLSIARSSSAASVSSFVDSCTKYDQV